MGAAGLLMLLRLFYKRLPKSLIPAAAGLGMLLFAIAGYRLLQNSTSQPGNALA